MPKRIFGTLGIYAVDKDGNEWGATFKEPRRKAADGRKATFVFPLPHHYLGNRNDASKRGARRRLPKRNSAARKAA